MKEFETDLAEDLNAFFDRVVNVERIKVGYRQTIDTLISEEAVERMFVDIFSGIC